MTGELQASESKGSMFTSQQLSRPSVYEQISVHTSYGAIDLEKEAQMRIKWPGQQTVIRSISSCD